MKDVLRVTGLGTKREAVELGLRILLRLRQQEEIRRFRGRLDWQGAFTELPPPRKCPERRYRLP